MNFLLKASAPGVSNWLTPDFCFLALSPESLRKFTQLHARAIKALRGFGGKGSGARLELVPPFEVVFIEAGPTFGDPELLGDDECIRLPDDFELEAGHDPIQFDFDRIAFHADGDIWLCVTCDNGETMEAQLPHPKTLAAMPITTRTELE